MKIQNQILYTSLLALLTQSAFAFNVVAHRGASYAAPENTLSSIKLAWLENADATEIDIYITKDKKLMLCHDDNTKRTSGVDLKISDATYAQLRSLDVGSWKDSRYKGEQIPTLQEALAIVPKDKKLYIEIKSTDFELVPILEKVFDVSGKRRNVIIISFGLDVLTECKKHMSDIPAYYLMGSIGDSSWKKICEDMKTRNIDGLDLQSSLIDSESAKIIKASNIGLHAWTVDDVKEAKRLKELGIDSITTNKPAFIRNIK